MKPQVFAWVAIALIAISFSVFQWVVAWHPAWVYMLLPALPVMAFLFFVWPRVRD